MMEIGATEWQRVKVIFITQTETYTLANSIRIGQMVSEFMYIKMDRLMKGFGEMICKMVPEKKN